jgi:hypothetical protein
MIESRLDMRGEVAAHPAFVDAVRAGDAIAGGQRALEIRRELAVGSRSQRSLTWPGSQHG